VSGSRIRIFGVLGFRVWGLGLSGTVAMLSSFLRAGIRHTRHQISPEGYLPRIVLNNGQGYSSASRSPKRPGEKGRGKPGEASIRQHRLASEVKSIVCAALQQGPYDAALLQRCGFEVEEVNFSPVLPLKLIPCNNWFMFIGMMTF